MFGSELSGGAHRVCPVELDMRPISDPDLLLDQTDYLTRLALAKQTCTFGLAIGVENLHPLPRRPKHLGFWQALKQTQCRLMVGVPAALVSQPPRRIRIEFHFFSVARKAAPLKRGAFASPTARFSASSRDILGRELLLTTNFGFPLAV